MTNSPLGKTVSEEQPKIMADSAERSSIINSDASRARGEVRDRALISAMSSGAVVRTIAALVTMGYFAISVRALSHAEFGVLATIATFTSLTAFADLGIGSGLMTRLAVAYGQDDYLGAKSLVSAAWVAMLILGLVMSLCGILLAQVLPWENLLGMRSGDAGVATAAIASFAICAGSAIPANIGQRILVARQKGLCSNIWLLASAAQLLLP